MPLVLIGAAANRRRTCSAMAPFLDKTGLYFFDTQMGMGVSDERRDKFLGTAALSDKDYLHCAIDRADLILNIGHDVIEKPPFFMEDGGKEVIHLNFFTAKVDDVYFPQLEVVGDIASSIELLTEELKPSSNWDFSFFERIKSSIDEHIHGKDEENSFPVIPQQPSGPVGSGISSLVNFCCRVSKSFILGIENKCDRTIVAGFNVHM